MLYDQDKYKSELQVVVDSFSEELSKITTGKPSISIFDSINVIAYSTAMPLSGVATITPDAGDPMSILLRVFDKNNVAIIKEAIEKANFNADFQQNDSTIRLKFKPLTEEDRAEKTKVLPQITESYKNRARALRREYNDKVQALEKVSEDEQKRSLEDIQEILNSYVSEIDKMSKDKESELMSI